ncbi:MAG TPA: bacterial transcriptional activator domain-containing protein [Glaciibacter sp.]|nr:bacterial transcriptional activator domain-containing protein [Glaciibacter sp.]
MVTGYEFGWELNLLGYWQLRLNGQPQEVGSRQQRLLSALALVGSRSRAFLADLLWPDSPESQAAGNLRASVFRVSHQLPHLIQASPGSLALNPQVAVDVHRVRALMREIEVGGTPSSMPIDAIDCLRRADLLPGWYEDWVIFEQERLRQQRIDSLENLARRCLARGDITSAKDAAAAAIAIEPLRESAHLLLVRSHLAEGNQASATRVYHELRDRLRLELNISPGHAFTQLLDVGTSFGWPASASRSGARARGAP